MNTKKTAIENLPPKGTADWFPEEFYVRQYIFSTFRKVCEIFGYEEYLTPTFEKAAIYKAKSGEDIGGKELMEFKDKAGRELALRPEMTPSVTRMISRIYDQTQKPIRYFSIANFFRNEKPQRGRNREFWQLNYDLFGCNSIYADIEIIKMSIEIMLHFVPAEKRKEKQFIAYINDRRIITDFLENTLQIKEKTQEIVRILDKKDKMQKDDFCRALEDLELNSKQIDKINDFMQEDASLETISSHVAPEKLEDIKKVLNILKEQNYDGWIKFKPNLIRGFDYYTGIVYEIFDNHPQNNRALFGGGRYDGLGELFGKNKIPAVGCAPGDEGIKLFLESWDLLKNIPNNKNTYYLPIIELEAKKELEKLAKDLRNNNNIVIQGLERESISKALEFANRKNIKKVVLIGTNELKRREYIEKDMSEGKQIVISL